MDTTRQNQTGFDQPNRPGYRGVFGLLQGIVEDLKRLATQQVQMAVHELQMEGARAISILVTAVISVILGALCLLFSLLTAAAALHELAGLAIWMSCGAIAVFLLFAVGGFLLYLKQEAEHFRMIPVRTLHTVKEDAKWIKEWIASPRT